MQRSLKPPKQSRFVSWFLSLLFCMLNGSSLFVCGMCFTVVIIFLTTDRDVDSFVVLVFISLLSNLIISFYILIRELLYKLIHFPVFEKYSQDYKLLYKKRSKKLQIEYLLICLGYFCGLTHIVIGYAFILRKILESLKLTFTDFARYPAFLVYMVTMIVIIMGNRSWKKITERLKARENVTVLAVEHGYPIFATKEEA